MEKIQWMASYIWHALNKTVIHQPLSLVLALAPISETQQECCQKVDLGKVCLEEAGCRFTQASQTPFLTSPLIKLFGGECSNPKATTKVAEGTFSLPAGCNPYAAQFLLVLVWPPGMQDVAQHSINAYSRWWQKAREATGSSALGIHFGHYMARTFNPTILIIKARPTYHFEQALCTTTGRKAWM